MLQKMISTNFHNKDPPKHLTKEKNTTIIINEYL